MSAISKNPTKVITGPDTRWSYVNVWEPKSINGSAPKYSVKKTGVYRYVEAPEFAVLLFAYSVDSGPVWIIDLACGEKIPDEIIVALEDDSVLKWAFNASFERVCLLKSVSRESVRRF